MLSNHRLSRILRESVKRVLNEDVNTASPSPRIQKIYDKVMQAAQQLHGKKLVDKSSTWQVPFTVEYEAKYTNGGKLKVTRCETEETVYNNSGSPFKSAKSCETWLITDKNYKEKLSDPYMGDGLYDTLKYDMKCMKAYARYVGESYLHNVIKESVNKVLKEDINNVEDIPAFDVINKNMSMTELDKILTSYLFDKNGNCVGRLNDLHFKYDPETNQTLGQQ